MEQRNTINVIGVIGFVLSIVGLVVAIIQVESVKKVGKQTQKEVSDSLSLYSNILMISDLATKVSMVNEIQGYLKDNKIEMCIMRMKDLKIILNSLKNQDQYHALFTKKSFNEVFSTFNIDLDNIQQHLLNERKKLDKSAIVTNMEALSTLLLSVEVKLKTAQ